jgi:hypothetical protein
MDPPPHHQSSVLLPNCSKHWVALMEGYNPLSYLNFRISIARKISGTKNLLMEDLKDGASSNDDQSHQKAFSKRVRVLMYITTFISLFFLVRYSVTVVWDYVPRISIQFPRESNGGWTSHITGVQSQNPGWIRPCSAPQPNLWGGLSESDVETVLETIYTRKGDVGIKQDAKM